MGNNLLKLWSLYNYEGQDQLLYFMEDYAETNDISLFAEHFSFLELDKVSLGPGPGCIKPS